MDYKITHAANREWSISSDSHVKEVTVRRKLQIKPDNLQAPFKTVERPVLKYWV